MGERPIIELNPGLAARITEWLSYLLLVVLWIAAIYYFRQLPETIPVHFNFTGEPNRYGSKNTVFLLPAIGTIIFMILTVVGRFPQIHNYPSYFDARYASDWYAASTQLLRRVKVLLLFIFSGLLFLMNRAAHNKTFSFSSWFIIVVIAAVLIPLIFYFRKARELKNRSIAG